MVTVSVRCEIRPDSGLWPERSRGGECTRQTRQAGGHCRVFGANRRLEKGLGGLTPESISEPGERDAENRERRRLGDASGCRRARGGRSGARGSSKRAFARRRTVGEVDVL